MIVELGSGVFYPRLQLSDSCYLTPGLASIRIHPFGCAHFLADATTFRFKELNIAVHGARSRHSNVIPTKA
jgi:hypothetical protein